MATHLSALPQSRSVTHMRPDTRSNPFNITKAVDFSDREILDYWVDLSDSGGFSDLLKPCSPMPMIILGGKGSGKTHLLRYFSYQLQKLRYESSFVHHLCAEGYVGIYLRCGGLNAARFSGKGQTHDTWTDVFAYYMDLWLCELVISFVRDARTNELALDETALCRELAELFDEPPAQAPESLEAFWRFLKGLRANVDAAINNCALTGQLPVRITCTRGRLVFGTPAALVRHVPQLESLLFVYLIDELENLSEEQQKYVNTLLREKESPCSFKIGARLYGLRTLSTYSAEEANKEGSEFEFLLLDERLRLNTGYAAFARRLVARRICAGTPDPSPVRETITRLDDWFEAYSPTDHLVAEAEKPSTDKDADAPYFVRLRQRLEEGLRLGAAPGVTGPADIDAIIEALRVDGNPLLEKANTLAVYKAWAKSSLVVQAERIQADCRAYVAGKRTGAYARILSHFKNDLLAQALKDFGQRVRYVGLDTFIDMSWGLPRNLLILLKHVYSWAIFNGEDPFRSGRVSIRSQEAGVAEASDWFFRDARKIGGEGKKVQDAIDRLGTFLQSYFYSDRPGDCSVCAFNASLSKASEAANEILRRGEQWSLLINVGERAERNTRRMSAKFQLNRMLAPRWELPLYRRGVLELSPREVNAIFDPSSVEGFQSVLDDRTARLSAPLFATRTKHRRSITERIDAVKKPHTLPFPWGSRG